MYDEYVVSVPKPTLSEKNDCVTAAYHTWNGYDDDCDYDDDDDDDYDNDDDDVKNQNDDGGGEQVNELGHEHSPLYGNVVENYHLYDDQYDDDYCQDSDACSDYDGHIDAPYLL